MTAPTAAQQILTRLAAMEQLQLAQARQIKELRRLPEERFRQISAVAAVTARALAIFDVPGGLAREWQQLVIEGGAPEALERATAHILSCLTQVRQRMDRMIEGAQHHAAADDDG